MQLVGWFKHMSGSVHSCDVCGLWVNETRLMYEHVLYVSTAKCESIKTDLIKTIEFIIIPLCKMN